jgi:hypothetical protein
LLVVRYDHGCLRLDADEIATGAAGEQPWPGSGRYAGWATSGWNIGEGPIVTG